MHDVVVAGGGPGGLYAATLLARQGFDVVVAEEHRVTGEPVHCTGVLATEAFDQFDVPREAILNPLGTARFFSPAGHSISYSTSGTEALAIDRARFDAGLHRRAHEAGVHVTLGARVTSIAVESAGVHVSCQDGRQLRGRVAIIACGASYSLQRQLKMGLPSVYLRSAQLEVPAERSGDVEVHFGRAIAPKGFAWVVPVQRGSARFARVGLMCDRDATRCFREFSTRVSRRWGLRLPEGETATPRQKILPLAPIRRTYTDRVLAVGDAAGLVKATTGGGIYYSLLSASLAAEVLAEGLHRNALGASELKQYERLWKQRLGSELRAQLALRVLAHRLGDDDIDALFDLARTNGVMPIVRQTARFNEHRTLIVSLFKHPPARRLLFKQLVARTTAFSLQ